MAEAPRARKDFFISYTDTDAKWAEWIAAQLEAAGYSTIIQAWDFRPGTNLVLQITRPSVQAVLKDAMSTEEQREWAEHHYLQTLKLIKHDDI